MGASGASLDDVAAPPYDVIDEEQRAALERREPHNAVRLILPCDGEGLDDHYERAAHDLQRWIETGVLRVDSQPRFYGYRMHYVDPDGRDRTTTGVLGALGLPEPGAESDILPHELTMPKARSDRLSLLRATRANLDPIWVLSLARGLTELVTTTQPLSTCTDDESVVHELFAIDDPRTQQAIVELVGSAPALLADGHHRFETARALRDELTAAGEPVGGAGAILALVVELADEQLCIEPIHRLVRFPGIDLRERLADVFSTADADGNTPEGVADLVARMDAHGGIGLVDTVGVARLELRAEARDEVAERWPLEVAGTDSAVVETLVVPRLVDAEWSYRHDAAATAATVDKGAADAAFLLRPVTVEQTRAAALAGARMPQKTTFFWPKPRTGMVFRSLDV